MARQTFDAWANEGQKTMGDRIQEKIRAILETHKVPPLSDSVLEELEHIKKEGEKELTKAPRHEEK
jgi:trimethylamine--corrinoid protein Co-methyltransferase